MNDRAQSSSYHLLTFASAYVEINAQSCNSWVVLPTVRCRFISRPLTTSAFVAAARIIEAV
jgi:hypothetical protein